MYEDQMNEAKAKVEELQRQLNETSSQRARAQAESGKALYPNAREHISQTCMVQFCLLFM